MVIARIVTGYRFEDIGMWVQIRDVVGTDHRDEGPGIDLGLELQSTIKVRKSLFTVNCH